MLLEKNKRYVIEFCQITMKVVLLSIVVFFHYDVLGQSKLKEQDSNSFELLFGGYTVSELNCEASKYAEIRDKKVSLRNKSDNSIIEIDSFMILTYIRRGPVYDDYVKGNLLPLSVQERLLNHEVGVILHVSEVYYYKDNEYRFHLFLDNLLHICRRDWYNK